MKFVLALNAIHENIWALVIIAAGVVLIVHKQEGAGGSLVTLGAAIFQRQSRTRADDPKPNA